MSRSRHPRLRVLWPVLGLVWLVAVGAAIGALWHHEHAAGVAGTPPYHWPLASRLVAPPDRPTLVVAVHPRCPCSQASLEELDRLMAGMQGRVATYVLFVKTGELADDWLRTDLWRRAQTIRGVTVWPDSDGSEAERFHAVTSGQTMLYDADGRLLFSGGITGSRGHAGDNAGRSALTALLSAPAAATARTPVFGCTLPRPGDPTQARSHAVL